VVPLCPVLHSVSLTANLGVHTMAASCLAHDGSYRQTASIDGLMDILAEITRVIELEGRAIARLRQSIGPAYEEAVRLIYRCPGKVILTGIGKSGIIAQKIASTMVSTGTPALFLHPAEGMHGEIGLAL